MSSDVADGPETGARSAGWGWGWVWWPAVILMLYVLSTGPVLVLVHKKLIRMGGRGERVIEVVYWPIDWADRTRTLGKPLRLYWHLWVPEMYDSQGKMKLK